MNKEIRQAYAVLQKVYKKNAFAGIELNKTIQREQGNVNTKLVTKLVYGVIEKDITLNYFVSKFIKSYPSVDVEIILKLGAYILHNINSIPAYACINELVEMTKVISDKHTAGFVNATLKNIAKQKITYPDRDKDIVKYLSVRYSYPEWVVKQLLKEQTTDFVEELLSTNLSTLTHIRILEDKIDVPKFIEVLDRNKVEYTRSAMTDTLYVEYSELLKIGDLSKAYIVQGLPSMIVARNIKEGSINVLDLCASPGGKSVYIAQHNKNTMVTSCDVSDVRVELIKKYANTYNVKNIEVVKNDATVLREDWIGKYDTVLCDVPCSNLGIANKKPDVLINKDPNCIQEITDLQLQILKTASNYVKPGGVLLYSTCSILKEENEKIVGKFLQENKYYKILNIDTSGVDVVRYHNLCTFYPNISKCEGFFVSKLEKK